MGFVFLCSFTSNSQPACYEFDNYQLLSNKDHLQDPFPGSVFWVTIDVIFTTVCQLVIPTYIIFHLLTLNWHIFITLLLNTRNQCQLLLLIPSLLCHMQTSSFQYKLSSSAVYEYVEYHRCLWGSDGISTILCKLATCSASYSLATFQQWEFSFFFYRKFALTNSFVREHCHVFWKIIV